MTQSLGPGCGAAAAVASILPGTCGEGQAAEGSKQLGGTKATQSSLQVDFKMAGWPTEGPHQVQ